MDTFGFACLNPEITEGTGAIFFDKKHGMCECHSFISWNKLKMCDGK